MASSAAAYNDYLEEPEEQPKATASTLGWGGPLFYTGGEVSFAMERDVSLLKDAHIIIASERSIWPRLSGIALSESPTDPHSLTFLVQSKGIPHAAAMEAVEEPVWKEPTVLRLAHLLQLPEGWDSYGALRIDLSAASSALSLLESAARGDAPPPAVVPTSEGGVQFEWHVLGVDLELDVPPSGTPQIFFRDRRTGTEWEQELGADLQRLSDALSILAERAGQERGR